MRGMRASAVRVSARRLLLQGAVAIALSCGGAACTLVSGWSDLQHGQRTDGGGVSPRDGGDAASIDGEDDGSGSAHDGAPPTTDAPSSNEADAPTGIPCGSTRCTGGLGCCLPPGGFGST